MPTTTTTSHAFWTEASKTKPKKQRLGYANENHNHGDFITLILVGIMMIFTWTLMMVSQHDMELRLETKIDKLVAQKEVVKENIKSFPNCQTLEAIPLTENVPAILTPEDVKRLKLSIDNN